MSGGTNDDDDFDEVIEEINEEMGWPKGSKPPC